MNSENIIAGLKELLDAYQNYSKSAGSDIIDLQSFSLWLFHQEAAKKESTETKTAHEQLHTSAIHGSIDDKISFMLFNMQKLIKFYVKKALEGTQLVSIDDIHFLLYLAQNESMKKSEIINSNITEMSSGIEVIKRLLKKELIEDFDDPNDKRSKRVKITAKGIEETKKLTEKFENAHKLITSGIEEEEKFNLLALLHKIHSFHLNIYNNEKNSSLVELFEKYLTKN
ncbi:MAG: winged helix DNA-binding protein [Bacteroidota bacterium]